MAIQGESRVELKLLFTKGIVSVRRHREWMQQLVDPLFWSNALARMQNQTRLAKLVALARQVIQEEIYSISRGEGLIEESIEAAPTQDGFGIRFNPAISTAKGPMENATPEQFSYVAFFENPDFNSFLPPKDQPFDQNRHRPFMTPLTEAYHAQSEIHVLESLVAEMRLHKPR